MPAKKIDILKITAQSLANRQYQDVFPEYYDLAQITENSVWHDHQNVLDHVIGVFAGLEKVLRFETFDASQKAQLEKYLAETVGNKTRREILMVATLLHDIAKGDTLVEKPDGTSGCPGHELIGAARVKKFAERFDLDPTASSYVERIVRYHSLISDILSLIISNQQPEKYTYIFQETVGDITIELSLLAYADLLGSDLNLSNPINYKARVELLAGMLSRSSLAK